MTARSAKGITKTSDLFSACSNTEGTTIKPRTIGSDRLTSGSMVGNGYPTVILESKGSTSGFVLEKMVYSQSATKAIPESSNPRR